MKYYLKPHVTEEMLKAVGFEKFGEYNHGKTYERDVNIWDDNTLFLDNETRLLEVIGYEFGLKFYIQDLIKLGYVEVRND